MPFDSIKTAQRNFNQRYGVKFDIDEFDGSVNALSDLGSGNVNGTVVDDLYRATFTEMYKKAYDNFVDRKIGDNFDFVAMLDDFDKTVMAPYRAALGQGGTKPRAYGGWTVSRYLNAVNASVGSVADSKIQYALDRYSQRKLPIRSMRAYARQLKNNPNPSTKELSTLYCYAESLLQANKERKGIWKLLNLSRHLAEQREAKEFKKYISQVIGEPLEQNSQNKKFGEILAYVNDDLIARSKTTASEAAVEAENKEKILENNDSGKQRVNISDIAVNGEGLANNKDKIIESKQISKSNIEIV